MVLNVFGLEQDLRVIKNDYIINWEINRILPYQYDKENNTNTTPDFDRHLTGQCCGNIHDIMNQCIAILRYNTSRIKNVCCL